MHRHLFPLLLSLTSLSLVFACAGATDASIDSEDFELGESTQALSATDPLSASLSAAAPGAPIPCSIRSFDGHFLTAVGGGGRTTDVIHTDATQFRTWETFELTPHGGTGSLQYVSLQSVDGHFLTAVGGGGRISDVLHTNSSLFSTWERFGLFWLGGNTYAIRTFSGNYLTAVDSGGRITDTIHSNATVIGTWEHFDIVCNRG